MAQAITGVVLEPAAQRVVEATANPPYLFQLPVEQGRAKFDELQSGGAARPDADVQDIIVGTPTGPVPVRIVRPCVEPDGARGGTLRQRVRAMAQDVSARPARMHGTSPVTLYLHGAGWVFGGTTTHDRLIRELAVRSGTAVVFPVYSRAPEARYPAALHECYAVAEWIVEHGPEFGLDPDRMAVAGDSVGGALATAVAMMARERGGPRFRQQVLFYPVTDAGFDTGSYREFAEGYYLGRDLMAWFWEQYLPDKAQRADPMVSPLRAGPDQLRGLPPALITTNEADVLRDEGEAYAAKLRRAGVPVTQVRYQGAIHDLVMLDALADTCAARAATAQAALTLHTALHA
ncbi:acetyl esterase [Micromonospora pattaloongensis]|uniref:Acetyl esterase n=1 Tax=Micromonospora pattaloongensis TaxID=405436 RepID=A0A1H3P9X8_9ACTN|nr:alpha/beta hydrolase [Micromonospora pattaloongensis]SDY97922.1 acetyl esterase [Micromonospora pattaloongensis]